MIKGNEKLSRYKKKTEWGYNNF